jgi:hypothetical protein
MDMGTARSQHSQQDLLSPPGETGQSIERNEAAVNDALIALEDEWWSLPFAAAGNEFAGLEPINLFRQVSDSFG